MVIFTAHIAETPAFAAPAFQWKLSGRCAIMGLFESRPCQLGAKMIADPKPSGSRRVHKHPKYLLKVCVEGPGVRPKSISVPDLVRICDTIQTAVYRQAEVKEGERSLRPGPVSAAAHQECTLELTGLGKGSTTLSFRLAKPQQPLPLPDMVTFGASVIAEVASTINTLGSKKNNGAQDIDAGLLDSFRRLGEILDRRAITQIKLTVPRVNGHRKIVAVFNKSVRERVLRRIKVPTEHVLTVDGILEMADFKELGKLCRVHPSVGQPIQCVFEPEKEDEVYQALRRPVRLTGLAKINPNTGKAEELQIREIETLDPLLMGAKEFFASRTLEQLAQAQGVGPLTNPDVLLGGWPDEDNLDQFLEETYQTRSD